METISILNPFKFQAHTSLAYISDKSMLLPSMRERSPSRGCEPVACDSSRCSRIMADRFMLLMSFLSSNAVHVRRWSLQYSDSSVKKRWFQLRCKQMGPISKWEACSGRQASTCGGDDMKTCLFAFVGLLAPACRLFVSLVWTCLWVASQYGAVAPAHHAPSPRQASCRRPRPLHATPDSWRWPAPGQIAA